LINIYRSVHLLTKSRYRDLSLISYQYRSITVSKTYLCRCPSFDVMVYYRSIVY